MSRICTCLVVTLCAFVLLTVLGTPAMARVTALTVYPGGADVTESVEAANASELSIPLPPDADPQSFTAAPPAGVAVTAVRFTTRAFSPQGRAATLLQERDGAQQALNALTAQQEILAARINLWTSIQLESVESSGAVRALDAAMNESLTDLKRRQSELAPQMEQMQERLKRAERALREAGGTATQAPVAHVRFDAPVSGAVLCGYRVRSAGWQPQYRLDARPDNEAVQYVFAAQVRHASGRDYDGVALTLATTAPSRPLTPPQMPAWEIGPRRTVYRAADKATTRSLQVEVMQAAPVADEASAPVEETGASFSLWRLGTTTLPAGQATTRELTSNTFPASFTRLVRPARAESAWLRAVVDFPRSLRAPAGTGVYTVQGELVGSSRFSTDALAGPLFFGEDTLVSAQTEMLERASGERGFLSSTPTWTWRWRTTVTNGHTQPVTIRVEEPLPRATDQRVELEESYTPAPDGTDMAADPNPNNTSKTPVHYWEFELAGESERVIEATVQAEGDGDFELSPGWR